MLKSEYLKRVKKQSNVWYGGKKVTDLTSHKAFCGSIELVADYFAQINENPSIFGAETDYGFASRSLSIPRSRECLKDKRIAYKKTADLSHGMLGRTPDFMNAAMVAIYSGAKKLGKNKHTNFSDNAQTLYRECCTENLFISHAAINPQIDRSKSLGELDNTFAGVRVTSRDAEGITVSGAKMIVTLGPIADQVMIFNMPGLRQGDEDFAVAFVISTNTKGLKFLCRNGTIREGLDSFDRPLANSFDEIDALMILEDVHVPWNRVLVDNDVAKSNAFFDELNIRNHTGHQSIVRGLSKIEFVGGIALKVADLLGIENFMPVQQKLGEITSFVELTGSIIKDAEQTGSFDQNGVLHPNSGPIQALRLQFPKWYKTALDTIQSFCAGSMMSVPSFGDFNNENDGILHEIFGGEERTSRERFALLNLAWDVTGTGFGQRQLVYETFHSGDPMRIAAGHFTSYDKSRMLTSVERVLGLHT